MTEKELKENNDVAEPFIVQPSNGKSPEEVFPVLFYISLISFAIQILLWIDKIIDFWKFVVLDGDWTDGGFFLFHEWTF